MNLTLKNTEYTPDGIFGELLDENLNRVAFTLQHAYDSGNGIGSYVPKVPPGAYLCVKGEHKLEGMTSYFTTYEVTKVQGCTGILFHVGNFNKDSAGCILLGSGIELDNNPPMITASRLAFQDFIVLQSGLDSFTLVVK